MPNSLIVFCGNARNATNPRAIPLLKDYEPTIDAFYEGRQPIEPDLKVATLSSCPQLGEILYLSDDPKFAMMITNLLDRPIKASEAAKLGTALAKNVILEKEDFIFAITKGSLVPKPARGKEFSESK